MNDSKNRAADYMLAVMDQLLGTVAIEKEVSQKERLRICEMKEVTVIERHIIIHEWEVNE